MAKVAIDRRRFTSQAPPFFPTLSNNPGTGSPTDPEDPRYPDDPGPAPSGGGGGGSSSQVLTFSGSDPYNWLKGQVGGLDPTADNLDRLIQAINAGGGSARWATNASGRSDDKAYLDDVLFDLIRDVGGPNAAWQFAGPVGGGANDPRPGDPGNRPPGFEYLDRGGTGYQDAPTDLYVNEVLSYLENLRKPIDDPFRPLFELMALGRVGDLQGAPYTAGEDAALRARYLEPLTQARDANREFTTEQLGRYGYLPSSGLFQERMGDIDRGYERNVAAGANEMAVRAIQEKQNRENQALDILGTLVSLQRTGRDEDLSRGREVVSTSKLLPDLGAQRLDELLRASDSGSAAQGQSLSALMQLLGINLDDQQYQQARRDQSSEAWGAFIASVLDSLFG